LSRRDAYLTAAMPTLRSLDALEREGLLSPDPRLEAAAQSMAIAVTPEMAALIDRADLVHDPIARQFVPSVAETEVAPEELADPIGDEFRSPVKGIVHRYPDRVLLKPLHVCPVYCRFCFRREKVGPGGEALSADELDAALAYIRARPEIWEVIPDRRRSADDGARAVSAACSPHSTPSLMSR
jgi:lysine 2,3-aminomutase